MALDGSGSGLTVWFDGNCPLCCREMALIRRLDKGHAINFVDLATQNIDCPVGKAELVARLHARENGRLVSGAGAFAAVWRAIPLLRPMGLLARIPFVLAMLERGYAVYLRFRPRLQQLLLRSDDPTSG